MSPFIIYARILLRGLYGNLLEVCAFMAAYIQLRRPFFMAPVAISCGCVDMCTELDMASYVYSCSGGAIVTHENNFLVEFSSFPWGVHLHPVRSNLFFFNKIKTLDKAIYLLTPEAQGNFYHWIIDCLPRIQLAKEFLHDDYEHYPLLLHPQSSTYEIESLQLTGLGNQIIHRLASNETTMCNRLLIPKLLAPGPEELEMKIALLHRLFSSTLSSINTEPPLRQKLYYISRSGASRRKLHHELLLVELLRDKGFVEIHLESIPLLRQIQIFQQAHCVIAPHGAGLALAVFMKRGSSLIEIMNRSCPKNFYRDIAKAVDLDYSCLYTSTPDDSLLKPFQSDPVHGNSLDLCVSQVLLRDVETILQAKLNKPDTENSSNVF